MALIVGSVGAIILLEYLLGKPSILGNWFAAALFPDAIQDVLTYSKIVRQQVKLEPVAFLVKPAGLDRLTEMVRALQGFWFGYNRFPGDGRGLAD
jgi:hypothetical protein